MFTLSNGAERKNQNVGLPVVQDKGTQLSVHVVLLH
jgi:hypothetical protein